MKEEYLMTGPLEPTNEGYALAKISGIKMAQYYHQQCGMDILCPIPCNLYGTNDHFDLETAHVLAALVKRFSDAKEREDSEITLWGTGSARREFLHVEDFARALMILLEKWKKPDIINVGSRSRLSQFAILQIKSRTKLGSMVKLYGIHQCLMECPENVWTSRTSKI